jgi:carbon storage regulator
MLILSRKLNESIVIDGRIIVKVLRIERDTVKLGIQAPPELPVHRQEVFDAIQRASQQAMQIGPTASGTTSPLSPLPITGPAATAKPETPSGG